MMTLKLYQIDAFTDRIFGGNPAAVCLLDKWLSDEVMQHIAAENNLAETAFIVKNNDRYDIRWFTPVVEVDLCGHATLASAHVIFNYYDHPDDTINFYSAHSGMLSVSRSGDDLTLNFPIDTYKPVAIPKILVQAFENRPEEAFKGKTDYVLIFSSQKDIENVDPDMRLISACDARGVMITAPGNTVDFVSRFFAPQSGIDEDPVTGSAHTTLTPIWSEKLGKTILTATQLSKRQGQLSCELKGDRVNITGRAVTYLIGEITI